MTNDIPSHVRLRFTSNGARGEPSTDRTRWVSTKPDLVGALDFIRLSQLGFPIGTKLTLEMPGDYVRLSQLGFPIGTKLTLEMPGDYVRTWEIVDGSEIEAILSGEALDG